MAAQTAPAASGSQTQTNTQPTLRLPTSGTLRLRATPAERRHIQWAEDVVDNEGMGKKSSKVCCIYHPQREVGESSDESSSDSSSDSDSDSDVDNGDARPAGGRKGGSARRGRRPHGHKLDHEHEHGEGDGGASGQQKQPRRPSPNAYEKMPKLKK
ncbi:hypothetical protein BU23DRAFT_492831 [Bimuria novae-zelandiae CBS 107.79]|uniref:Type 1 phosphatases regulator n=1 Tax=Bimuria novae-zelandiae CBS 107.79 TaxID=1447943 RepID=A0A6A5UKU2_9PLEO|nr:hypothetical protein BU23DRAFT_492831 [Bimuria novae-zelandiae CBS 107.79]